MLWFKNTNARISIIGYVGMKLIRFMGLFFVLGFSMQAFSEYDYPLNKAELFGENQIIGHANYHVDRAVFDKHIIERELTALANDESTFHLFSHGQPGALLIDGEQLSGVALVVYLRPKLIGYRHLNIYGCAFAQGEEGKQAVGYLESELGISVAASDDVTGIDGDWELEVGSAVSAIAIDDYQGNLQVTPPTIGSMR